jgi:hypothetical protein
MTYHCSGYGLILSISSAPESSWVLFDSIGKLDISSLVFLSKVDFSVFGKMGLLQISGLGLSFQRLKFGLNTWISVLKCMLGAEPCQLFQISC